MKEGSVEKITNSKSKTFLAFCFCFVLGVSVFSGLEVEKLWQWRLYVLSFVIGFFIVVLRPSPSPSATPPGPLLVRGGYAPRFFLTCILFFILGGLRFLYAAPDLDDSRHLAYYNGERMEFTGRVIDEPDVRVDGVRYVVGVNEVNSKQSASLDASRSGTTAPPAVGQVNSIGGKVQIKLPLYPRYEYGDELAISCILQSPKNFPDSNFRYDNYLARSEVFSVCVSSVILSPDVSRGEGSLKPGYKGFFVYALPAGRQVRMTLMKHLLLFKNKIHERVERLWPEPESSLVSGLLYGARGGFSPELLENFNRAGITHIIAISGYNISIVAAVLMAVLIRLGLYRRQAFWLCVAGLVLFVLFAGASPSVVRAGIMGIIVLIAKQLGRLSRAGNILALTAALMLLFNPYVLIWDAGFQLSFLATLGLVYLSPIFSNLNNHPLPLLHKEGIIRETFVSTFSAIIATLPLILYQFGRLSLIAPLANLLILWLIPFLMFFGFMAVVLSFVFYPLGQLAAYFTGLGLKYVIITADYLGKQSWAAADFSLPLWGMAAFYVLLAFLIFARYESENKSTAARPRV